MVIIEYALCVVVLCIIGRLVVNKIARRKLLNTALKTVRILSFHKEKPGI